ncbi:MAG: flagellar basal body P-ring formation chaperone FlgA [Candidatus Poribacteria bacterium]|nr:flagellar basal body P-ring formation chaperone FlgA [Candidatus Poribacteria bacterium]MDP6748618.1 flagellar basal body P-ring formation chaperone FlgA [Candidatus Poribacteria bacterium]MDP6996343.1 flagellar basal body P-ring formation chaperone FlgA [Candidatus Poribacteria bacterium]MDP7278535.1 flagellar basal body P-ring formation chaperone FlgA [Candidatus Poribacteria bacterium]
MKLLSLTSLFLLSNFWMVGAATDTTIIYLLPVVTIEQKDILIGDIAQVEGVKLQLLQQIKSIKVGSVNQARFSKSIGPAQVNYWLKRNQIDLSQIEVRGRSKVSYQQPASGSADLLAQVKAFYQQALQIKSVEIRPRMKMPVIPPINSETRIQFKPKGDLQRGLLGVEVYSNNTTPYRTTLSFEIRIEQAVVIAKIDIPPHTKIEPSFLKLEAKVLDPSHPSFWQGIPISRIEKVAGQLSSRQIRQGQPITDQDLQKIYCVAKDSPVTIIAQHGQLKIQAQGVACENGELGQLIRIKNISSKKEITGQIIGQKKVQIHF